VNQKGVSGNVAIFEALNEIDDAGKFGEDLVLVRQSVRHAAYCSTVLCSTQRPAGRLLVGFCLRSVSRWLLSHSYRLVPGEPSPISSLDVVWSGLVWSGLVWSGLVWSGLVCRRWSSQQRLQCA
jgi:hypothetical protein